mmetsp:Transcript_40196/g.72220  ORF Transcript_40196/g.72220 Transcript_40196/m.72220 type:complete len:92 (+) Transcript_40196:1-276(+)
MAVHSVMLSTSLVLAGICSGVAAETVTCRSDDPESCSCDGKPIGPHTWSPPSWMQSNASSLWDLTAQIDGEEVPLSKYRAKAALVVNVASA